MKKSVIIIISLLVGIALGWTFFGGSEEAEHDHSQMEESAEIWTCSMHPNVRKQEPGQCPICGMDLIPAKKGESNIDKSSIEFSEDEIRVSNIQTLIVGKSNLERNIRLNGKIEVDETKTFTQPAHFSGRIEELYINYTGAPVKAGQKIAKIYSPELVLIQKELLSAYKVREDNPGLYKSVVKKLKLRKIHDEQINSIIESGGIQEEFIIYAHQNGYVSEMFVRNGGHIQRGDPIFKQANLTKLWAIFDAYENDLANINVGDKVKFSVAAMPGKDFTATINYIDPVIDKDSRTVKVRADINNPGGSLKPEMLAIGQVISIDKGQELIIPRSSVLWTGERSVVFVKKPNTEKHIFKARKINIGSSTESGYPVKSGLEAGEEIAVNGTFTIDAAAQIAGKPSMMQQEGGMVQAGHAGHSMNGQDKGQSMNESKEENTEKINKNELSEVVGSYSKLKDALVETDFSKSKKAASELKEKAKNFKKLSNIIDNISNSKDIEEVRKHFIDLSNELISMVKTAGISDKDIFVVHCPMANNNEGADWISLKKEVRNPYYGDKMLKCGSVTEKISE